jgi:SAM-dependent methyltransferase
MSTRDEPASPFLENPGFCPTCAREVTFCADSTWLRESYRCSNCGSIPRERALMLTVEARFPDWRGLIIHESSPVERGASVRLARECPGYIPSQFYPDQAPRSRLERYRCENLESLTFADESIDLHITQDVLEHVFQPSRVFAEIARTLRPGGAHVFTVPIVNKHRPSVLRARRSGDGGIEHLEPPVYHGNPIDDSGSLVTVDWGFDICERIHAASGLFTHVVQIDDLSRGIRAEYIEVLVSVKPGPPSARDPIP